MIRSVFLRSFLFSIAAVLASSLSLLAQQTGAITGTVVDQAAKLMPGANVTVRTDDGSIIRSSATDEEGHFSITGLPPGNYTVETTEPGFARNIRRDVILAANGSQDLSITMNVDAISQSVTVNEFVSKAVEQAPQGNTLDAASARTEISNSVIVNFMPPVADFAEVIQQAPNAFSLNPNGIGLGQGKSFFRGFQDGQYTITFDGIPFEDTNTPTHHSWASFP
ncbi:MAG: carboxypeptidase regulatory-like domain-containing protein, partial [Acidobacteriia bacterium]|nr:carboxypeptidase regulatory-like domain-containing protein [Terriglobia bacterium]